MLLQLPSGARLHLLVLSQGPPIIDPPTAHAMIVLSLLAAELSPRGKCLADCTETPAPRQAPPHRL